MVQDPLRQNNDHNLNFIIIIRKKSCAANFVYSKLNLHVQRISGFNIFAFEEILDAVFNLPNFGNLI